MWGSGIADGGLIWVTIPTPMLYFFSTKKQKQKQKNLGKRSHIFFSDLQKRIWTPRKQFHTARKCQGTEWDPHFLILGPGYSKVFTRASFAKSNLQPSTTLSLKRLTVFSSESQFTCSPGCLSQKSPLWYPLHSTQHKNNSFSSLYLLTCFGKRIPPNLICHMNLRTILTQEVWIHPLSALALNCGVYSFHSPFLHSPHTNSPCISHTQHLCLVGNTP